jgi:hypothetical protein
MKGTNRKGKPLAGIMNADEMEGYDAATMRKIDEALKISLGLDGL